MAATESKTAVEILVGLGMEEAEAKMGVDEGKISLRNVRRNVTDTSVVALAEHCPGMEEIHLNWCENITDTSVIALAEHCQLLKEIRLVMC